MDAAKMNLGIAFYAKYFETVGECTEPVGCETAVLEDANGLDTGKSGAKTFLEGVPVLTNGIADDEEGGEWYWDSATKYFWTWDTPEYVAQKFEKIVKAKGLGGISKFLFLLCACFNYDPGKTHDVCVCVCVFDC